MQLNNNKVQDIFQLVSDNSVTSKSGRLQTINQEIIQ